MQSTTRLTTALLLWVLSMVIFLLSSPYRSVRAFSIQSQTGPFKIQSNRSRPAYPYFSPLFATSSDILREQGAQDNANNDDDANEITIQTTTTSQTTTKSTSTSTSKRDLQYRKRQWIERSTAYYSTVMRNESRRARGQIKTPTLDSHKRNFIMAKKLYFARNKVKIGDLHHAETIYRKLIAELMKEVDEGEECDHAQLAISTLLLALLLQRKQQVKETRAVFIRFFKIVSMDAGAEGMECACSAKVLQAYALFEMKQGHIKKSYELAEMAVKMDAELEPLLQWKQFRDAKKRVNPDWSL